jgi:hypothetical protein
MSGSGSQPHQSARDKRRRSTISRFRWRPWPVRQGSSTTCKVRSSSGPLWRRPRYRLLTGRLSRRLSSSSFMPGGESRASVIGSVGRSPAGQREGDPRISITDPLGLRGGAAVAGVRSPAARQRAWGHDRTAPDTAEVVFVRRPPASPSSERGPAVRDAVRCGVHGHRLALSLRSWVRLPT